MVTVQDLGLATIALICGVLCCGGIVVGGLVMTLWRTGILRDLIGGVTGAFGAPEDLIGDGDYQSRYARYRTGGSRSRSSRRPSAADAHRDEADRDPDRERRTRRRRERQDSDDEIDSFLDEVEIDGEDY